MNVIVAFTTAAFAAATAVSFAHPAHEVRDPNVPTIAHARPWHCASQSPQEATASLATTDTRARIAIAVASNDEKAQRDRLYVVDCVRAK